MSFYGGQLKQQICYSFTLLTYMVFNPFKMGVRPSSSSSFPNWMVQNSKEAPGPDFRKLGKSLGLIP